MENVIDAVEVACFFDGGDIGGLFDDANEFLIPSRAAAVDARLYVGDVIANGTEAQLRLDVTDGYGERFGIFAARAQDMERQALSGLAADAGQFPEFVNEPGHGLGKARHRVYNW